MGLLRAPDGSIVTVPDEQSGQLIAGGYTPVDEGEAGATTGAMARPDSGALGGVGAFASSTLSGATLGLSDVALKGFLDRGDFERLATDRENHPITSGVGQFAGTLAASFAAPGSLVGSTPAGLLSQAGRGATEAVGELGGAAGALAKLGVAGAEGSIYNAGAYLSDTALGDRDLSAEGLAGALGSGFEFGVGGGVAAMGIEHGTIAARRMFSRLSDSGGRATAQAEQEWLGKYQSTIDANDAAADMARAKLAEAQLARQHAGLARDQASAAIAETKANAPELDAARTRTAFEHDQAIEAERLAQPAQAAAPSPGMQGLQSMLAGSGHADSQIISEAAEREIAEALQAHDAARNELETMLRRIEAPGVQTDAAAQLGAGVPVGEFGAPGARGYDPGNVRAPGPPSQAPLAGAADGTPVTRAMRKAPVPGEPTTAFDFEDSGLHFDPETRNYSSAEPKAAEPDLEALLGATKKGLDDGIPMRELGGKSAAEAAPASDLESLLRGTQEGLAAGKSLNELGAPVRAEYASAKAVKTSEAAAHFRSKAREINTDDEFHAMQDALRSKLTPDEIKQSIRFSREYYMDVNRALRPGRAPLDPAAAAEITPVMDSVIEKSGGIGKPIVTHRAVHLDPGTPEYNLKPGDTYYDPGFGSTSRTGDNIHRFGNVHFEITSPTGTRIAAIPSSAAEGELTLARGTSLKITDRVEHPGGNVTLRATVVKQDGNASLGPGKAAAGDSGDLMAALQGTKEGLDSGKGLREIGGHAPASHPLAVKQLEVAHEAAVERAATALEPAERAAAEREAAAIEQHLSQVSARPGAIEDIAAVADAATKYEASGARLTEALGPEAPASAQEAAKAFRDAESTAERKTMDRTTRAIDDHAEQPATATRQGPLERFKAQFPEAGLPKGAKAQLAEAKAEKLTADAVFSRAKATETEARMGAKAAKTAADETRAAAETARPATATPANKRLGMIGTVATAVGIAGELGVPGIPKPHDIPVIGPLLSIYLKYRAIKAAAGRFVGRIPATADARAAALIARTKDRIASAVDYTLGLGARPTTRTAVIAAAAVLGHRAFDDGEPDAPKGASPQALAAVRIREIANAASRPELVQQQVRKQLRGIADPDLIAAAEQHMLARFQYLASVMPKMPPPNPFSKTEWQPSPAAADELAQRLTVAHDPEAVFKITTPATVDTANNIYPKVMELAKQRLMERVGDMKNPMSYQEQLRGTLLFGIPMSPSMTPDSVAILQSAHAAMRPAPAPQPASPPTPSIAAPAAINQLYNPANQGRSARM